jgi:hypothetical protein
MKKTYTLLLFLLATVSILAQAPEKMSYQAVLRDASNTLLTNQEVGMQISILQSTITGTAVYIETQTATTNINGLVSIAIGSGTSSDDFSAIDWSAGPYFIKTETDPAGGTSYSITGTSQLMSVPFAVYANTSGSSQTNATNIDNNTTAIAANTDKVGITAAQASAITANTTKTAAAVSVTEVDDEFTATTSQTAFTLSQVPSANSKVKMYVNGIRISKTAYDFTHSDTALSYNSANNGGYALTAGDRIQFDYFY